MDAVQTYRVAGFCFRAEGLPFEPENMKPFRVQEEGVEPIFSMRVVSRLPEVATEFLFRTDDGPGVPEITIYTEEAGYRFETKPLPHLPVACEMSVDADFRKALLEMKDTSDLFSINNAMMLMFTFATARLGALEMHSSVVMNGGKGYMFLGRSGTGKSTHSRLWLEHIPGSELLNDDNPILRIMDDGSARVFGSPWSGKTPCYKAMDVPVRAVVRLSQAPANHIERLPLIQAYASLMASSSGFRPFRQLADGWHATLEKLAAVVPCFHLECLPDRAAAELCYNTVHE